MLAFYYILFDFRAFRSIRIYVRNVQGGIPLTHLETIALGPSVFVKGVTFVRMENAAWGKHSLWFHCFVCKEMPRFNHLTSKKHYNAIQNFARGRCLLVKWFGNLQACKLTNSPNYKLTNLQTFLRYIYKLTNCKFVSLKLIILGDCNTSDWNGNSKNAQHAERFAASAPLTGKARYKRTNNFETSKCTQHDRVLPEESRMMMS